MKLSYRQILASAGGAVLSAVVASIFGVKGTIVGVAIGSIAATMGTVLIFQSIERTNTAVKQVAVRVPESSRLLRRLGGTKATGVTSTEPIADSPVQQETTSSAVQAPRSSDPETKEDAFWSRPSRPPFRLSWPLLAAMIGAVFVFTLVLVTVVELIAGHPLADLFGHSSGGTTVEQIFENSPTTTLPPPGTTTTSPSSTTTTSSSSTTTTVVGSTTSSTDTGSTTTSSTTVSGASTSTTTATTG